MTRLHPHLSARCGQDGHHRIHCDQCHTTSDCLALMDVHQLEEYVATHAHDDGPTSLRHPMPTHQAYRCFLEETT